MKMHGRLILFCSYAPGAGKTSEMLKYAESLEKNGQNCFPWFLDIKGRDYEKDNVFYKRYLAENTFQRKVGLSEWIILDELGLKNVRSKKYVHQEIDAFVDGGISVITSCNLQVFEYYAMYFRRIFKIWKKEVISERYLDLAGKIYFIDRNPEKIVEEHKNGKLFMNNNIVLEKYMNVSLLEKYREWVITNLLNRYSEKVVFISLES
jgi:K+-sensing histidine kinase KdpD